MIDISLEDLATQVFSPVEFPQYENREPICQECFEDSDLRRLIDGFGGPPGCDFCNGTDAPTAPLSFVTDWMRRCLMQYYGFAADQLPYESKEGGYQGKHWTSYELLYEECEFGIGRDPENRLYYELPDRIGQEIWCEYNWLQLDYDRSLIFSWENFCAFIKHERRFFFTIEERQDDRIDFRDVYSPVSLLDQIRHLIEKLDIITVYPSDTEYFRARSCNVGIEFDSAEELGPPPANFAIQSNRMNPPGIPMTYLAETAELAVLEARRPRLSVGRFAVRRKIRMLNLADLPEIPGIFSGVERDYRLGLIFIHEFAYEISKPVEGNDRIHIDYIPSQVVTEFVRDTEFHCQGVDGIRYRSSLDEAGRNIVLFATQNDLIEPSGQAVVQDRWSLPEPWLQLVHAELFEIDTD